MRKIKKIFTNVRVIILIVALLLAVIAISPNPYAKGVAIRNVLPNSSASLAGIESPAPNTAPMSREVITAINSRNIVTLQDFYEATADARPNSQLTIHTDKRSYPLRVKEAFEVTILPELEEIIIEEIRFVNITVNGTLVQVEEPYNRTMLVNKTLTRSLGAEDIGLRVYQAPTTNIRKGLDLQGGTRVLLEPDEELSKEMFDILLDNMKQRLNIYGLSDIIVRQAGDFLSDKKYIVVEIAGVNEEEVKSLISTQGKFEAKIGNESVFLGGSGDITYVCRSADCSGIDPFRGCGQLSDGSYACSFRFSISLKQEAAKRMADITRGLDVRTTDANGNILPKDQQYLSHPLQLYLDDRFVDELNIAAELKGREVLDIQISGSGVGTNEQLAAVDSLANMKELQTVLITGSLPTKLNIVKTDNLSPEFGIHFIRNALLVGFFAMIAVALVVFIRYKKYQVFVPMVVTMMSEVILLLGLASVIGWNLDLAAIAGIIIAVGTGVDHQIVITDEALRGERSRYSNWKDKIKNAFFIILLAYFTMIVAMIPLLFAGAGLLKGFALTTIMGVSFGVFVTRPAFAAIIEIIFKD